MQNFDSDDLAGWNATENEEEIFFEAHQTKINFRVCMVVLHAKR